MGRKDRSHSRDRERDRSRRERSRDRDKGKSGPIDPERSPERYAQYLRDKQDRDVVERRERKKKQEREARMHQLRVAAKQEFKAGAQVTVHGLQKNPDKNGAIGTLREFLEDKGRWAVDFSDGNSNNFKEENLQVMEDATDTGSKLEDDADIPTAKVYISNLAAETLQDDLIKLFGKIGLIAREPIKNSKGKSKGYEDEWPFAVKMYKPGTDGGDAVIEYKDRCASKAAIKAFNGYLLHGNTIKVDYAIGGEAKVDTRTQEQRDLSEERKRELGKLKSKLREQSILASVFG